MKKFLLFLTAIMLGIFLIFSQFFMTYQTPSHIVTIDKGANLHGIAQTLYENQAIKNKYAFIIFSYLNRSTSSLKAGTYAIPPRTSIYRLHHILEKGLQRLTKITIPEGFNIYQIANVLQENKIINSRDEFIFYCKDSNWVSALTKENISSIEGFLYPETYYFAENTKVKNVITTMFDLFQQKTKNIFPPNYPLSKMQIITLASIIEKETSSEKEKRTISSVMHNRLNIGMPLQSDPTTIYGMYERYDGNIRKQDLREVNNYNTYTLPRLPIGPIANPSLSSIYAAIDPEKTDFLYFVSNGRGSHWFASSYNEHRKNIEHYKALLLTNP